MSTKYEFWRDGYWGPSTEKNDVFWLLWGIFKEYIKQNIIMAVLRKANALSLVICRLIKKINNVKEDPEEKNWFKLWFFPSCLSAYEVLITKNVM